MDQNQPNQVQLGIIETKRRELQTILENILSSNGLEKNVYFQPPETLKMSYPCIVYHRQYMTKIPADNIKYLANRQYRITYIDRSPISGVIESLLELPFCRYISHSIVDNLNQDAFEIYY